MGDKYLFWHWDGRLSDTGRWLTNNDPELASGQTYLESLPDTFTVPHSADYRTADQGDVRVNDSPPPVYPPFYGPEKLYVYDSPEGRVDGIYTFAREDDGETKVLLLQVDKKIGQGQI